MSDTIKIIFLGLIVIFTVYSKFSFIQADESPAYRDPKYYEQIKQRQSYVPGIKVIRGETQVIIPQHENMCPVGIVFTFNSGDIQVSSGWETRYSKRSSDGGKSWYDVETYIDNSTYQYPEPDGEVLMFSGSLKKTGRENVCSAVLLRSYDNGLTLENDTAVVNLPEMYSDYRLCRRIVGLNDGSLLMSLYGFEAGSTTKKRVIVIGSTDRGKTWNYRTTVAFDLTEEVSDAGYKGILPEGRHGGFKEPCLLTVPYGRIFCFMRSGASYHMSLSNPCIGQSPLYMSISNDGGESWSNADPITPFGVYPCAAVMENGVMVVNFGRPGNWIMFSRDSGRNWGPIIPIYHDLYPPDCGNYLSLSEVAPNTLLVVYARTDPNDSWLSEIVGTYYYVRLADEPPAIEQRGRLPEFLREKE